MIKFLSSYIHRFRNRFEVNDSSQGIIDHCPHRPTLLFVCSIIFYSIYLLILQPSWVLSGEMWAEMATNYYINANSPSLLQNFFATDAGYIPLPPRIIALSASALNLPAQFIPYFYTWSAIFATALMVGSFCLRAFRRLIENDFLRFLMVIAILMVVDFESRTFINFTYFSVFFIGVLTALAFVEKTHESPCWSWLIPVLILTKPATLAILPAMVLTALVSNRRFKNITLVSIVVGAIQIIQLIISQKSGAMPLLQLADSTFTSKILTTFSYFFGFIGQYTLGPTFNLLKLSPLTLISIGFAVFCVFIGFIVYGKKPSVFLIVIGLSLVFFQLLINSFGMSVLWNEDLVRLQNVEFSRMTLVIWFGITLIVGGVSTQFCSDFQFYNIRINYFPIVIFVLWFVASGWALQAIKISKRPPFPITANSQWQLMSPLINSDNSPLCVPIDPIGWIYQKNCRQLNPDIAWGPLLTYLDLFNENSSSKITISIPHKFSDNNLLAFSIPTKPYQKKSSLPITVKALLIMKDGNNHLLFGEKKLKYSGGAIMIITNEPILIKEIQAITLEFDQHVSIGMTNFNGIEEPAIVWMGN